MCDYKQTGEYEKMISHDDRTAEQLLSLIKDRVTEAKVKPTGCVIILTFGDKCIADDNIVTSAHSSGIDLWDTVSILETLKYDCIGKMEVDDEDQDEQANTLLDHYEPESKGDTEQ